MPKRVRPGRKGRGRLEEKKARRESHTYRLWVCTLRRAVRTKRKVPRPKREGQSEGLPLIESQDGKLNGAAVEHLNISARGQWAMLHLPPRVSVIAAKCHAGTSVNKIRSGHSFFPAARPSKSSAIILAIDSMNILYIYTKVKLMAVNYGKYKQSMENCLPRSTFRLL